MDRKGLHSHTQTHAHTRTHTHMHTRTPPTHPLTRTLWHPHAHTYDRSALPTRGVPHGRGPLALHSGTTRQLDAELDYFLFTDGETSLCQSPTHPHTHSLSHPHTYTPSPNTHTHTHSTGVLYPPAAYPADGGHSPFSLEQLDAELDYFLLTDGDNSVCKESLALQAERRGQALRVCVEKRYAQLMSLAEQITDKAVGHAIITGQYVAYMRVSSPSESAVDPQEGESGGSDSSVVFYRKACCDSTALHECKDFAHARELQRILDFSPVNEKSQGAGNINNGSNRANSSRQVPASGSAASTNDVIMTSFSPVPALQDVLDRMTQTYKAMYGATSGGEGGLGMGVGGAPQHVIEVSAERCGAPGHTDIFLVVRMDRCVAQGMMCSPAVSFPGQ